MHLTVFGDKRWDRNAHREFRNFLDPINLRDNSLWHYKATPHCLEHLWYPYENPIICLFLPPTLVLYFRICLRWRDRWYWFSKECIWISWLYRTFDHHKKEKLNPRSLELSLWFQDHFLRMDWVSEDCNTCWKSCVLGVGVLWISNDSHRETQQQCYACWISCVLKSSDVLLHDTFRTLLDYEFLLR